jgi:hypothetical protein
VNETISRSEAETESAVNGSTMRVCLVWYKNGSFVPNLVGATAPERALSPIAHLSRQLLDHSHKRQGNNHFDHARGNFAAYYATMCGDHLSCEKKAKAASLYVIGEARASLEATYGVNLSI